MLHIKLLKGTLVSIYTGHGVNQNLTEVVELFFVTWEIDSRGISG